ncbi:DUF6252 family protein [Flaviramulus sp. BrNp1-15]|uniref:DUF6252 family protein n=1 Tax=Flaviramulus sp. BrNp1-15 TaxID=2916754 RepID=UPI001EE7A45F|nr:DUF6252 family protein [Flaviramulus sp. BrNp1-15]ULC60872.1 DUF6252 family protein [Flaviramulus sp. BrNp1-15]
MNLSKFFLPATILLLTCFITSCNIEPFEDIDAENVSEETEEPETNVEPGAFKVDFDDNTFNADVVSATLLDNVINISGIKTSNQEFFALTLFANTTGTYQLGVTENDVETNSVAYNNPLAGEVWVSVIDFVTPQGEVTITEIDEVNKTISGTFSFTGYNTSQVSKAFTNGVFSKISYSTDVPSSGNDNSFFAKVDGEEFVEDGIEGALLSIPGTPSIITISATKNSLETISISVNSDITDGTYDFSTFDPPMGQYNLSLTESAVSDNGTLTITSHDVTNKRIIGTFNFNASSLLGGGGSYEITEGSFDVTYN